MLVGLMAPLAIMVPQASAAIDTCTWTGGGADDNFMTTGNWSGCDNSNMPEAGDNLVFDADTSPKTVTGNATKQ